MEKLLEYLQHLQNFQSKSDDNCESNTCIGTTIDNAECLPAYPSCNNDDNCSYFSFDNTYFNGICFGGFNGKKFVFQNNFIKLIFE